MHERALRGDPRGALKLAYDLLMPHVSRREVNALRALLDAVSGL